MTKFSPHKETIKWILFIVLYSTIGTMLSFYFVKRAKASDYTLHDIQKGARRLEETIRWQKWFDLRLQEKGGVTVEMALESTNRMQFFTDITLNDKYKEQDFLVFYFNIPQHHKITFQKGASIKLIVTTEKGEMVTLRTEEIIACKVNQMEVYNTSVQGFTLRPIPLFKDASTNDFEYNTFKNSPFRFTVFYGRFDEIPQERFEILEWKFQGIELKDD